MSGEQAGGSRWVGWRRGEVLGRPIGRRRSSEAGGDQAIGTGKGGGVQSDHVGGEREELAMDRAQGGLRIQGKIVSKGASRIEAGMVVRQEWVNSVAEVLGRAAKAINRGGADQADQQRPGEQGPESERLDEQHC